MSNTEYSVIQKSLTGDLSVMAELQAENDRLKSAIREAYEVWAGSEHCKPETAPESYMDDIIMQMKDVLSKALSTTKENT